MQGARVPAWMAPSRHARLQRRMLLRVRAALTDKGKRLQPADLRPVGSVLGEGSYGQVFKGVYSPSGRDGEEQAVILKRVRPRVQV